jgi:ribosomal protein L11 methyltransferase
MPFWQISLEIPADRLEPVESLFEEAGAVSTSYLDPGGDPVLEPAPGENPLWARVRLVALFDFEPDEPSLRAAAAEALDGELPADWSLEAVENRVWERAWMDHYHPMAFGERLWVVPTNVEPPEPDAINLRLDPGLAFGTGTHATTALCLRWLDGLPLPGKRVIDYGCGSGILAVASLLLGAERCIGVDNDPQALLASRENAERNGVAERLQVFSPEALQAEPADVVVANILAGILIELAPVLAGLTRPGGVIGLSGLIERQIDEVAAAFEPWFELDSPRLDDGWVLLAGRRR